MMLHQLTMAAYGTWMLVLASTFVYILLAT